MSMEISSNYSNYAANSMVYGWAQRDGVVLGGRTVTYDANGNRQSSCGGMRTANSGSKNKSNIITSTVELKTSTPGVTKTEQIKTGYSNVNDYSKYLQEKYSYMNKGMTSMQGVPTTVLVSSAFLEKCMNDPEKAAYLEENLAAIPDCVSYATSHALGTLTSISYEFDANGNITIISSGTNDPDGKIAKENAKRKAQEKKAAEDKAAKRRTEKKAAEEKAAKRRAARKAANEAWIETGEYTESATGTDIKAVTQSVVAASLAAVVPTGAGIDMKA